MVPVSCVLRDSEARLDLLFGLTQDMFKRVEEMEKAGMTDSLGPQVSRLSPAPALSCSLALFAHSLIYFLFASSTLFVC